MKKIIISILILLIIIFSILSAFYFLREHIFFEGARGMEPGICFPGLTKIGELTSIDGKCVGVNCLCFRCTKCGDGKCGNGENWCNCPEDCKPPKVATGWQTLDGLTYNFKIDYPIVTDQWGRLVPIDNHMSYGFATVPLEVTANGYKYLSIDINGSCDRDFENKSTKQVTINGINFTEGSDDVTREYTDEYCMTKDGKTYRLKTNWSINSGSLPSRSDFENDPIINRVMSSFKFTN